MLAGGSSLAALLEVAKAAAAAGAAVLEGNASVVLDVRVKGELGNLVTDVDLQAERSIRGVLTAQRPADTVCGEELPDHAGEGPIRWVIDPLDGTTNYSRRIPFYCSSVAAQEAGTGRWLVGVVHAPELRRIYWAGNGLGAWLTRGSGKDIRLDGPHRDPQTLLLGMGLSYDPRQRAGQLATLPEIMKDYTDLRRLGSAALDLCLAADGTLDGFIEADLFEYDWAAGALIAEEAGMQVTRPDSTGGEVRALPARI